MDQEAGGARVIPGGDQPSSPRSDIETDAGVRARPDIDGDDSSRSTIDESTVTLPVCSDPSLHRTGPQSPPLTST